MCACQVDVILINTCHTWAPWRWVLCIKWYTDLQALLRLRIWCIQVGDNAVLWCYISVTRRWQSWVGFQRRLSVCLSVFPHDTSRKPMQLKSPNLTCFVMSPEKLKPIYFGVSGQGHESQKHCQRGSLHFCECWLVLVIYICCSSTYTRSCMKSVFVTWYCQCISLK